MKYLALGDSISIDDYTGVPGGGAANQFARLIGATEMQDLAADGCTTDGVLQALDQLRLRPDITTVTAGGNDFLEAVFCACSQGRDALAAALDRIAERPLRNLSHVAQRLQEYDGRVILNTVYDPTDGDDGLSTVFGIPPEARPAFDRINEGIRALAQEHGFILSDLAALFAGHGVASDDPWFVLQIEPNYAGATAVARHWYSLFRDEGGGG